MIVFTVIVGGYDKLKPIQVKNHDWRYVCITDDVNIDAVGWELLDVNRLNPPKGLNPIRLQRWAKITGAVEYFQCATIYVDGSHEITGDITDLYNGKLRLKRHPVRDCYVDEGNACVRLNKDHAGSIMNQIKTYQEHGLPERSGMFETGVVIRPFGWPVQQFGKVWWDEVKMHSHRDQLSVMYAIMHSAVTPEVMEPELVNKYIRIHKHG